MKSKVERIIVAAVLLLSVISIVMVASSTVQSPGYSGLFVKQSVAVLIGLILMWAIRNISYELFLDLSPVIYLAAMAMLVFVFIFGTEIYGSRRWFDLGPVNFQPAEFAKLASILFGVYLIKKKQTLIKVAFVFFLPAALIIIQPDAGTALMFLPAYLGIILISGRDIRWAFFIAPFALVLILTVFGESYVNMKDLTLARGIYLLIPAAATLIVYFALNELRKINRSISISTIITVVLLLWVSWGAGIGVARTLKDYQKKRIVSFMVPDLDPLGAGYNVCQSIVAVGSGKFTGKGLHGGTQTQLGFLPVRHTDFIFAVIAEETGFLGATAVLLLLGILLWQFIRVMERAEYSEGKMLASGIFLLVLGQASVNLGVTLGIMPVIGIQLPFVSYGGSGVIIFMALTGIILNINRKTEIMGI